MEITWIILAIGFVLLASRRFRPDFVVIATLVALQLSGSLTLEQALSGFSNPAVLTMAAFMILSYSARSIDWSPRWEAWLKYTGRSTGSLCFWTMWGSGLFSGILQEEQSVGVLMPGTIRAGRQRGVPPSKLLLPLAYGALLGRTFWLVGSPAALLVVWAMAAKGISPFGVLDFVGINLLLLGCASLFLAFVGHTVLRVDVRTAGFFLGDGLVQRPLHHCRAGDHHLGVARHDCEVRGDQPRRRQTGNRAQGRA